MWFKLLQGGDIKSTVENLQAAAEGENYEWTDMYDRMAKEAREEGFNHIAFLFEEVGKIEKEHEARYKKLIENVEGGLVFSRDGDRLAVMETEFGNVETADTSLLENQLQKFVQYVAIQKLSLKLKLKIINICKGKNEKFLSFFL